MAISVVIDLHNAVSNGLTASESFGLPAHNSTKLVSLIPEGSANHSINQQKRILARGLDSAKHPWPALHMFAKKNEFWDLLFVPASVPAC